MCRARHADVRAVYQTTTSGWGRVRVSYWRDPVRGDEFIDVLELYRAGPRTGGIIPRG